MNGEQLYKVAHMSDEQKWREVKRLLRVYSETPCGCMAGTSLCLQCAGAIDDIEEIVEMVLRGIDGPNT